MVGVVVEELEWWRVCGWGACERAEGEGEEREDALGGVNPHQKVNVPRASRKQGGTTRGQVVDHACVTFDKVPCLRL